ncbi:MAG: hypothetical protein ACOYN4_01825 [Bacteroidales bacterium]
MNNLHNDINLIESYLEGSLTGKELADFNERIQSDSAFNNLFDQRKLIQESYIEATERNKLKKQIRSIVTNEKRKSSNQRRKYLIAASLISIMGIASFFLMQTKHTSTPDLAKQEINYGTDEVISGNENRIVEYGSADTFNKQPDKPPISFLPPEGAIFRKTDTIWFFPPNATAENQLFITDKTGNIVKKVTLKPTQPDYRVLPDVLKPGTYIWYLSQDKTIKHSFKIK